jgi:signal transduction histidine kinase
MQENSNDLTRRLLDDLGQRLAGIILAVGALSARLTRRRTPEAEEVAVLLEMLPNANEELNCLVNQLDAGEAH